MVYLTTPKLIANKSPRKSKHESNHLRRYAIETSHNPSMSMKLYPNFKNPKYKAQSKSFDELHWGLVTCAGTETTKGKKNF